MSARHLTPTPISAGGGHQGIRLNHAEGVIAVRRHGDLYVSMASPAEPGVMILRPDGPIKAQLTIP